MTAVPARVPRFAAGWFTAGFWLVLFATAYLMLLTSHWWELIGPAAVGAAVSYAWWIRRRRGRFWPVTAAACVLLAAVAVLGIGRALAATVQVPVDSVGERVVECGSVVDPVPNDRLTVTRAGGVAVSAGSIPTSELARVCDDRLGFRAHTTVGMGVAGALLVVRAVGHVRPRARALPVA